MSNNETGFIKFVIKLLVLGLMTGLAACDKPSKSYFYTAEQDEILGGKSVQASSVFSKKVIYLALGVDWTKTKTGVSVNIERICTASAISKRILLTAAHCVNGWETSQVNAALSLNPFKNNKLIPTDWIKVEKIEIHAEYATDPAILNDVALVKLSQDLSEERISKLAELNQTSTDMQLISIGYGRTDTKKSIDENEGLNSLLSYVLKPLEAFIATESKFAIEQFDKTGICSGDSGSPGFIYDTEKKEFVILGVASYVTHPDNSKKNSHVAESCHGYGVYMNILYFKSWILNAVKQLG